ncbi:hypothetical protein [uncultured Thiodictyon sp.]|uniref:hypothetical protein n=1 Tax=uncultured Thiodictyon sp. TaxID=1846217 RepID=UPI0025F078E4|nr:hypothetical protein [uncultured Thiodictyon sp.]
MSPASPNRCAAGPYYCLNSEPGYQALYDALLDQAGIEPGPIGEPKRRPRPQGEPLTFDDPPPPQAAQPAAPRPASPAARLWAEKLEFLREQEAICSDPAQRFTLKQQIAEAAAKLAELSQGA